MLFTDNLSTRIAVILLAGFVAAAILVVAISLWPVNGGPGGSLFDLPLPQEAAAMVDALDGAPPADRPTIVRAFNNSVVAAELAPGFPPPPLGLRRAPQLEALYTHYGQAFAGRRFEVYGRNLGPFGLGLQTAARASGGQAVRIAVALNNGGGVLVMERRPSQIARSYIARGALLLAVIGLVLLGALLFAVRQTARPVGELSAAVRGFAGALDAPDLPLTGPKEIRELSAAFNAMKGRIRGLVQDRTRVLAAVAHDMRTYLTRLRLRVDFIEDTTQRDKAVADLEEMAALLDDTLLFASQDEAGRRGRLRLDLRAEVAAFVALRSEMGEAVSIKRTDAAPLALAIAPLALRRLLANLTDNALRYAGVARLSTGLDVEGAWFCVEDDGPGIPDEALDRITEPFERLETSRGRATGGAGLGLSIVRGLAEAHGARLVLKNRPEGGLQACVVFATASAP